VTYLEWAIGDDVDPFDLDAVAAVHPAIGRTIDRQFLIDQAAIMAATPGEYARAYGNRWTTRLEQVIPVVAWAAIRHRDGIPADGTPPVLGADVAVDRSAAAIVACWPDTDGIPTLEVVQYGAGTDWIAPRLVELHAVHGGPVVLDGGTGPASTVVDQLRRKDELPAWVRAVTPREYTTACAGLLDAVLERSIRHRGNHELDAAAAAAAKRTVGDGWAWSRRTPTVDVSPLIAGSLALYGTRHRPAAPVRPVVYAG
jgi:hypothetical protein